MPKPKTPALSGSKIAPPPVSPQGRIYLYTDDDWEEFVREWVSTLAEAYAQIKRFGGSGDRGADVAALKTTQGLEGPWDCFQCKHYVKPLSFGDAAPEMLKVFRAACAGFWTLPDTYQFLAPKGCSTQLNQLLSQPTRLKQRFLDELADPDKALGSDVDATEIATVIASATSADFTMFKSVELVDAIAQLEGTPYYLRNFEPVMPARPDHEPPPNEVTAAEARYVAQLLGVYNERFSDKPIDASNVTEHVNAGPHFKRQREAFFKAEALRVYARDSVHPDTFSRLQDDIYHGVVDLADDVHPNGWTRMTKVLVHVGTLDLQQHTLIQVSDLQDRTGICHHLANANRLIWIQE
ncbi:ABC-three component system protein [Kribbella albertanoniae]|uniref:ABC-three component systems C-terminal domain-containing protein n=1 Tax=Kribbella albertanoniae TaxID=1266829 RepID=A0A4R4QJJ5_9ACTN|nr:ABC-three component system protein [Kribbella albertanoniae]TDC35539.1 hypothetical protein E1261_01360 [Kribbella albertanoniae]